MIMADVLKIFLLVTGGMAVLVAYMLSAFALAPRLVEGASGALQSWRRFGAALLVGAPVALATLFVALGLQAAGSVVTKGFALLFAAGPLALGFVGATGVALRIGRGLPSAVDHGAPWRPVLRGAIVLVVCFLLPFVGWFVTFPATLVFGLGAVILALRPKARRMHPAPAPSRGASWGHVT